MIRIKQKFYEGVKKSETKPLWNTTISKNHFIILIETMLFSVCFSMCCAGGDEFHRDLDNSEFSTNRT